MKLKYEFIKRDIAGDTYLVPVGEGAKTFHGMMALNDVGSAIFDLLETSADAKEIAGKLQETYEVAPEELLADTEEFLSQLRSLGIID